MNAPIRIVLFCGGRGSATIIRALLRRTDIELTLIVNAFDDGLSTGALRNFIPGMLGPSDFRKNFSHLFGNYSQAQYALKSLMEYRLPVIAPVDGLARFVNDGNMILEDPLGTWFAQLTPQTLKRVCALLSRFFSYAAGTEFDYRDCSLGNLVFAGAYLLHGNDFNAAAAELADLVGTRGHLLNVGTQQNRILVGLKGDGVFLGSEAELVGPQSASPITDIFLLENPVTAAETRELSLLDWTQKKAWLSARDKLPQLSKQAAEAIAEADIILYGPGTQHSSLFPSYRIAAAALAAAPAKIKALVLNLDSDNDIQDLSASDVVDRAMTYGASITHVLVNSGDNRLPKGSLSSPTYQGMSVVTDNFVTSVHPQVHNGSAVVKCVLSLWTQRSIPSVEIFADILGRSVASDELVEEFYETDWSGMTVHLTVNHGTNAGVGSINLNGLFPESAYFRDWLALGTSDYLVLMTGDGAYRFDDIVTIIRLLEHQQALGGVFGSRTQSRRQFITSIRAAYGENKLLYWLGKTAAFFLSALFYMRSGVIFSDPLTGLRVFRRRALLELPILKDEAPLAIMRQLIRGGVEVAELPVQYRTFSGFTDPRWRVRRGLRNLTSLLP